MKKFLFYIVLVIFSISLKAETYYVSTIGDDNNPGTFAQPFYNLNYGILQLVAGDTLFIRSGVYLVTSAVSISANPNNGTKDNPIVVMGYPGDNSRPIIDGSLLNNTTLLRIENKSHWIVKNIEIRESHDTDGVYTNFCGINCYSSNQIRLENIVVHDIDGQGFRIQDCDTIYIRDCDSYNNYDPYNSGGKADGFQINGAPGKVAMVYFDRCRAWNNSDDGWDFLDNTRGVVDSCWAWNNGYDTDGSGQGFKAGLQTGPPPSEAYVFTNNVAVYNSHGGMRANCNNQEWFIDSRWYNNTVAFNLEYGFNSSNLPGAQMYTNIWRNNISYNNVLGDWWEDVSTFIRDHNSWDITGLVVKDSDFLSVDSTGISAPRNLDGSLPENNCYVNFLKLHRTSDCVNVGIDVGLPYKGTAPDLGAFEYNLPTQIIANHTVVDKYDDIPQRWIDSVKTMWVSVAGESHSRAYRTGAQLLENINSKYAVSVLEYGTPDPYTTNNLRLSRATWGDLDHETGWRYSYGEEDWYTSTTAINRTKAGLDYCNNTGPELAALGFGWCWDPDEQVEAMDVYNEVTQEYDEYCRTNDYLTKVFFTTGPVDATNASGIVGYYKYLAYEAIRNYVSQTDNAVLFDYADILCYDDDGTGPNTASYNGNVFPIITQDNVSPEQTGHISNTGALRLGKALWWMLARIAGWDGNPEIISETDITFFTINNQIGPAIINTTNHTVNVQVVYGTDLTSLIPTITVSGGATIYPSSGVARNFTSPVVYTVTSGSSSQDWIITVTVAPPIRYSGPGTLFGRPVHYDEKIIVIK